MRMNHADPGAGAIFCGDKGALVKASGRDGSGPMVRDQALMGGDAPPGAVYRFAQDWKEEHVFGPPGLNASGNPFQRQRFTRVMPSL